MTFSDKLDLILSEDAQSFADSLGLPRISPWIMKQYNAGHKSLKDYTDIVNWVTNNNPSIDGFDFQNALKQARLYIDSNRKDGFNKYADLNSEQVVQDFENGKKWLQVGSDDCNAICHRLQYDCSQELTDVRNEISACYALQDPQENTICIFIDSDPHGVIIGQYGNVPTGQHQEIKALCVIKGLSLVPEAYSDSELVKALATKQLDVEQIVDLPTLFRKLSALDIINCDLLNHAHYAKIKTIYDLYNKTDHDCLLMYCMSYLIVHGLTNTPAYKTIKISASKNRNIVDIVNSNTGNDDRFYADQLEKCINDIQNLS
jgi:hypothetical protein